MHLAGRQYAKMKKPAEDYKQHKARVLRGYNLFKPEKDNSVSDYVDRSLKGMSHRVRALVKSKGGLTAHDCGRT